MKNAKRAAKYKIYFDRSRVYLSYFQLIMILKIFLSDIGIDSMGWTVICLLVCTALMFVIGWLDTYLGIRAREMENNTYVNPFMTEILTKLNKLLDDKGK